MKKLVFPRWRDCNVVPSVARQITVSKLSITHPPRLAASLAVAIIRSFWQGPPGRAYARRRGIVCRFHPSCSTYCILALNKYGFVRGLLISVKRVRRCNPRNSDSCIDFP
ncbi:MAG: membrane protein insertion efficiency factor YidD [Chthoniobacterales bacterium]